MEKNIFFERMPGLEIDQMVRDHEFSMQSRHFHDTYEIYFLLEGQRYYFIDKETYWVKQGMVVLVNRWQIHKTSLAGDSYHDRILLQLSGEVFDPILKANGLFSLDDLFSGHYGVLEPNPEDMEWMRLLLLRIRDELRQKSGRYEQAVSLMVLEILLLLNRLKRPGEAALETRLVQTARHQKVHEAAEYLFNHCETKESLEELARRFFVSKSYLCRIFKEITGFSVNEYRNITRINKARYLLKNSRYSITEISEILGFESVTYFEKVFKKHGETTPLKYRKG